MSDDDVKSTPPLERQAIGSDCCKLFLFFLSFLESEKENKGSFFLVPFLDDLLFASVEHRASFLDQRRF